MEVPASEILTGIGLLMNIVGVYYLTLTDLVDSKPIRMWWYYHRHVDQENPEDTDRDPPVDTVSPVGGGYGGLSRPSTTEKYNKKKRTVRNQSIAMISLIGGFILQLVGLFV